MIPTRPRVTGAIALAAIVTIATIATVTAVVVIAVIAPAASRQRHTVVAAALPPAESPTARADALFAQWNRSDSPGCSAAVSRDGVPIYERGYGMASLELGVAIAPASVLQVASISKQFTAMSVLLLVQQGRLSLDDEVRKHIPEWTDTEHKVTIRHLLTHTSGLRDGFLLIELAAPRAGEVRDRIVEMMARQRGLNFAPGSAYEYCNSGYLMLAEIVKRVSGQSLRTFADAHIFKPLGMRHTQIHDDPSLLVINRATGYSRGPDGFLVAPPPSGIVGTAGVFSTVGDLLTWEQNFAKVRVGDPALVAAMQVPTTLTGGGTSAYGFGLQIGQYRGMKTIAHGGGDRGISAYVMRFPDRGLAIAVLCNLDDIDSLKLAEGLADIHLGDSVTTTSASASPSASAATAARPTAVPLSAEQLASKEGLYRDPSNEALLRMFVRNGTLMGSQGAGDDGGWEVVPVSANRFVIPRTPIALEFVPAPTGRVKELHVIGEQPSPTVLQRIEPYVPPSAQLRSIAGDYTSRELDVTYSITPRGSDLVIQMPGRSGIVVRPIFPDGFAGPLFGVVKFSRDERGGVTGFTLHANGVRSLRFDRIDRARQLRE